MQIYGDSRMKKMCAIISLCLILGLQATVKADETSKLMKKTASVAKRSLVRIECPVKIGEATRTIVATGICIDSSGIFMALGIDTALDPNDVDDKNVKAYLPGNKPKEFKASLMGIDPMTGLTFFRVKGGNFTAITFMSAANSSIGDKVLSAGLMLTDPASPITVGVAYVSSVNNGVYKRIDVTGGTLGPVGSVVLNSKGQAIGLVGKQPLKLFRTVTGRGGLAPIHLKAEENTTSFIPAEEFSYILSSIPRNKTKVRMKWVGIGRFSALPKEDSKALGIKTPAARISQVIPGYSAANAGLRNEDIIVGYQGKPLESFPTPELVSQALAKKIIRSQMRSINLTVRNADGTTKEVQLHIQSMPKLPSEAKSIVNARIGVIAREKVKLDQYLNPGPTAKNPGLMVIQVGKNSPAQLAGLLRGDLIIAINGSRVATAKRAQEIMNRIMTGDTPEDLVLSIKRGKSNVINIKIKASNFKTKKPKNDDKNAKG